GKWQGQGGQDLLQLARHCWEYRGLPGQAVALYKKAFTGQPGLLTDLRGGYLFHAAGSAALAGTGQGDDAPLTPQEQSALRRQALDWLKAELRNWQEKLKEVDPEALLLVDQRLPHWLAAYRFAGLRDPGPLKDLAPSERQAWEQLWSEVAQVLARLATG